jgi:hypothetical protein
MAVFRSAPGTGFCEEAVLSETEACSAGKELVHPGWRREGGSCFANLSLGKRLVFLGMIECTASKKCTRSELPFDFRGGCHTKRQPNDCLHSCDTLVTHLFSTPLQHQARRPHFLDRQSSL